MKVITLRISSLVANVDPRECILAYTSTKKHFILGGCVTIVRTITWSIEGTSC